MLKIAGLLRGDIDRGHTILEVSKKLKIGYRPAHNHITAMANEDMIKTNMVGNARQTMLNLDNDKTRILLAELDLKKKEELYRKHPKLRDILEALVKRLDFASGIHSIVLFGSYAKGSALKDSDIDLLFIVSDMSDKKIRDEIERESASFHMSHNAKVNPLITDIAEFRKMLEADDINVGKEVRKEGISIYGSEMFWRAAA